MSKLSISVAFFLVAGVGACSQTVCPDGSTGSCEVASEDSDAAPAQDLECDDPNLQSCDSLCVDTDIDPLHCGDCNEACAEGEGCAAGECLPSCEVGSLYCGAECIDPLTNAQFCGASDDCAEENSGVDCGEEACTDGTCVTQRYLGSLPPTTGRWTFGGAIGVEGAELACQTIFSAPTATICSFNHLLEAQSRGNLLGALDSAGNPISSFHMVDVTQNNNRQCRSPLGENIPWSYETGHLGQGSKFVNLENSSGSVSQVIDAPPSTTNACGALRNVGCCLP